MGLTVWAKPEEAQSDPLECEATLRQAGFSSSAAVKVPLVWIGLAIRVAASNYCLTEIYSCYTVSSMSRAIDLPIPPVDAEAASLRQRRLQRLSRVLAGLFTLFVVLAVLCVVGACVFSAFLSDHVRIGPAGVYLTFGTVAPMAGTVLYSSQPAWTRIAGFLDVLVATVPIALVFWELRGLFRLYARGIVFARSNAGHLRRAGVWLIVYPAAKFAANALFQVAGGTDKAWFSMTLVHSLVLGLIVLAMSLVMEFGGEIEQEKDSFV